MYRRRLVADARRHWWWLGVHLSFPLSPPGWIVFPFVLRGGGAGAAVCTSAQPLGPPPPPHGPPSALPASPFAKPQRALQGTPGNTRDAGRSAASTGLVFAALAASCSRSPGSIPPCSFVRHGSVIPWHICPSGPLLSAPRASVNTNSKCGGWAWVVWAGRSLCAVVRASEHWCCRLRGQHRGPRMLRHGRCSRCWHGIVYNIDERGRQKAQLSGGAPDNTKRQV